MSWSYATNVLTSTGGTEGTPDSLLAGIAVVQAADAAKGYRSNFVAWLANVEVRAAGSFIIIDDDAAIHLTGSSFINPGNGGVIHGFRSTLIVSTSTGRTDAAADFETGSTLICRRANPSDPSPRIVYRNTARFDYPTILATAVPAKVEIAGLDIYTAAAISGTYLKLYFGLATSASISNVRVFAAFAGISQQFYATTYNDFFSESLAINSEAIDNACVFNRPIFTPTTAVGFSASYRSLNATMRNPTFLSGGWNGTVNLGSVTANSKLSIVYTFANTFKQGLIALEGVRARFVRSTQSMNGTPTWTVPNGTIAATSNASGTFTEVDLLDAYREGTSATNLIRYNWSLKARHFSKKTAGESIFSNRVLFQSGVSMASGYSEEVQMLPVANLTLTEAQAAALTGIAISASGATGGTVTINESHTTAEVWQYYRQWIAQTANFDSEDTWTFDGSVLNIGAWNVTVTGSGVVLSGDQLTTSGALTLSSGGTVTLNKYATMSGIMVLGSVSGLVAGSRVQIYNVTDATEMLNAVVAGTSTSFYVAYTSDKSIRVRVTHISRAEWDNTGTLTVNGFSFNAAQVVCPVYAENGIDGSTVTEFSTDLANVQIDISDGDGVTSLQRLFAWYRYTVTTESGIQHIYKGIGASDASNYTINSSVIDLKLDNVSASPVRISGGYLSATDGDTVIAATSGSIQMDAGKAFVANSATIVSDLNSIKAHTALIPTLI